MVNHTVRKRWTGYKIPRKQLEILKGSINDATLFNETRSYLA